MNAAFSCTGDKKRSRVALFGSFYGGFQILHELLSEDLSSHVKLVGVATDDPTQPYTHASVRLWKYPHTRSEELLVPNLASEHGLPIWTGRVRGEEFLRLFRNDWAPELCLMATFGQLIPKEIFSIPRLGFFNFHHSDCLWPSYPGPDPIAAMLRDGKTHAFLTMHEVTEILDGGNFVARSGPIPLSSITNAVELHRVSWTRTRAFVRRQTMQLIANRKGREMLPARQAA